MFKQKRWNLKSDDLQLRFLFKSELRISAAETRNSDLDKDLKSTIVIQDM